MLSSIFQVNSQKQKNSQKANSNQNVEEDAIVTLEKILESLVLREQQLLDQIEKDEGSYKTLAQAKIEKQLKQGASSQLLEKYEKDLKSSCAKKETKIASLNAKIQILEAQKLAFIQAIDLKIEKLEKDISGEEEAMERSENYFRPLIEKCYEEKPLDIVFPPSYYKKQEELKMCKLDISSVRSNIQTMKVASFNSKSSISPHLLKQAADWDKQKLQLQKEAREAENERLAKEEEKTRIEYDKRRIEREAREKREEEKKEYQRIIKENLERECPLEVS